MTELTQEKMIDGIKLLENNQAKKPPEEVSKSKKSTRIDRKKIDAFLDVAKRQASGFYGFFKDNRNNSKITLILALSTSALAVFFGLQLYSDITVLNAKSSDLTNLSSYDVHTLQSNPNTKAALKNMETIKDIVQENDSVISEISQYTNYQQSLQIPYTHLLKYIYLPSLNVRKDNYTEKIDTNLI
ncbi:MAG: hypothetical protein WCJ45_07345 [bacterium]